MASLKEIRNRIKSVSSTRKITSAMKMVSAAKLKKAQRAIENAIPYMYKVSSILDNFVSSLDNDQLPALSEKREVKRVAIIVVSSGSSLCGAFNQNIFKAFNETYVSYKKEISPENIIVYPIGKKIADAIDSIGIKREEIDLEIYHGLDYKSVSDFMNLLMADFLKKKIDKVEFIYNHFKTTAVQEITKKTLLPFYPQVKSLHENTKKGQAVDYLVEPDKNELINELLPKVIKLQLFFGLLDSLAAEHGARTTAMQIATDNADELIQDLKLTYNKLRQSSITTEIITITGGAEAIK